MNKKTMKQLLALALSALMVFAVVGCGSTDDKKSTESEQETTKESEVVTPSSTQTSTEVVVDDTITYPLETEDKLSVWSLINVNTDYNDYTESPFHTGLAEMTGVDVEWLSPAVGQDTGQAYNLLLTDEVLPDIIFRDFKIADAQQLLEDDLIYDLTEYLPKYAPDYWELINRPEYTTTLKAVTTSDGKQVGLTALQESDFNICYMGPVIRKDWLDECGLNIPVTLEDWETVLTTFKEKYNAKFLCAGSYFEAKDIFGSGTGAYASLGNRFYVDADGKIQFANIQPEWKEFITVLNRWYENDLIDKDILSADNTVVRAKILNNEVGAGFGPMSQLTNYVNDAEAEKTGAEWIGVGYPRTAEGEPTTVINTKAVKGATMIAVVTTSCPEEKLITALKWMNYGYTEEGMMYWNYGKEGVSYTLDANGEPQWTDLVKNDPQGLGSALDKYSGVTGSGISMQKADFVKSKNNQVSVDAVYTWIDNTNAGKHLLPPLPMTTEENQVYTDKYAQISSYVSEIAMKFVTGEESIDKFDAFVEQVKSLGLQECIDAQQAAYDRFMAN